MTELQRRFIEYWTLPEPDGPFKGMTMLDMERESIAEREAEIRGEEARFGDAGPGDNYRLNQAKGRLARVEAALARLLPKPPAPPVAPAPKPDPDDDDIPF